MKLISLVFFVLQPVNLTAKLVQRPSTKKNWTSCADSAFHLIKHIWFVQNIAYVRNVHVDEHHIWQYDDNSMTKLPVLDLIFEILLNLLFNENFSYFFENADYATKCNISFTLQFQLKMCSLKWCSFSSLGKSHDAFHLEKKTKYVFMKMKLYLWLKGLLYCSDRTKLISLQI